MNRHRAHLLTCDVSIGRATDVGPAACALTDPGA
jgi:hypothetical protein